MYYTYILQNSKTGRYYVGYSSDLKNRFQQHQDGKVKSTKSNLNYELVWYSAFKTRDLALSFEKYLKTGSGIAFMRKRFFKSTVVFAKEPNPLRDDLPYEAFSTSEASAKDVAK